MSSDWRDRAACQGMDTNLFFPETYKPVSLPDQRRLRLAVATCEGCPVRLECLAEAMTSPRRTFGIWGGLNENQRDHRKRRKRRKASAVAPALT